MAVLSLFAPYEPDVPPQRELDPPPQIRAATSTDVAPLARLIHERDGGELGDHVAALERRLAQPPDVEHILVAMVGEGIAGYARSHNFCHPPEQPPDVAPEGWYLAGLIVAPGFRRAGIGSALTAARLGLLARQTDEVFYFASAINLPTIDLHHRFGFVEVTREFSFPGASFTGGVGVLFRAGLSSHASAL